MAKLMWSLLCERVITDQATNVMSYVDAVEAVGTEKLPARLQRVFLCTVWRRNDESEELVVGLHVFAPSGQELVTFKSPAIAFGQERRTRLNFELTGIPLEELGDYKILLEQQVEQDGWTVEAELELEVALKEPAKAMRIGVGQESDG